LVFTSKKCAKFYLAHHLLSTIDRLGRNCRAILSNITKLDRGKRLRFTERLSAAINICIRTKLCIKPKVHKRFKHENFCMDD
jgi:hypothetical protein